MSILLTGGAGYIGSHTAVELQNSGFDIIVADNFSNSSKSVIDNIEKITGRPVKLYEIDVADPEAMDSLFAENHVDAVIHFAGFKAVGESVEQPLKYYRNNLDTAITLLEMMRRHAVKRVIFSSSATVYGIPDKLPLTEDMPTSATNPYGQTKLMIEKMMTDLAASDPEWTVVLLRYFNPVGAHESGLIGELPNGTPNNLMPYITQVAAGKLPKLHVYGADYPTEDGTGVRDYIHVVDLAKGHLEALAYAMKHKGVHIFNLGTGIPHSVLELIRIFQKVNNTMIPYVIDKRRSGDVACCYADPGKANRELHWRAEKTVENMCADAWAWQQYLDNRE